MIRRPPVADTDLALVGVERPVFVARRRTDIVHALVVTVLCATTGFLLVGGKGRWLVLVGCVMFGLWRANRTTNLVMREVHRSREHLELATAVFLELVNVMIAGGSGVETAVRAAAESGDGPGFSLLRVAVMRAHSSRTSYWESLAALGHETGVDCLVEVAHTMQLAGESGARVRTSLVAKASALRKKNLARVEHAAEQQTEKIGLPLVVLFMGFLGLVGYPAFSQAMSTF